MIVLDIETTGVTQNHGICEIAAIDLEDPANYFYEDCKIDDEDLVNNAALEINGHTRDSIFDEEKQTQEQMISNYLDWVEKQEEKIFFGQIVAWDISMIEGKCVRYGFWERYIAIHRQRGLDLHTIAQEKYKELYGKFLLDEEGKSAMGLGEILNFCGLKDERSKFSADTKIKEGKTHKALEDCKLAAECYKRLKEEIPHYGEFSEMPVPEYLKKE
ncbi:MAG: exonuclease domain-containing protein [Candidatus Pacearchaeota archaeon]